MKVETTKTKKWWHLYGGTTEGGVWIAITAGESTKPPGEVSTEPMVLENPLDLGRAELHYLGSFDHEPSENEKDALYPEEFREEELDPTRPMS